MTMFSMKPRIESFSDMSKVGLSRSMKLRFSERSLPNDFTTLMPLMTSARLAETSDICSRSIIERSRRIFRKRENTR
jgi:hypothetical protein